MSHVMDRLPYTYLLMFHCFTFICVHGRDQDVRNSTFKLSSDVDLTCGNNTWNETMFAIWTIQLSYKSCMISFSKHGQSQDLCNDGKSLKHTSSGQLYLHVPNLNFSDEGVYKSELVYKGGSESCEINVEVTDAPITSAWLEEKDNKTLAVCTARGKPAAKISWSHTGNSSTSETEFFPGYFTVESHLELLEGMDTENLSCAISHQYWRDEQILVPKNGTKPKPFVYPHFDPGLVPPNASAWLEHEDNKRVAVCKAERGKPAANISWRHTENLLSKDTLLESDGFFTVESRLEILEGMDTKNLTCAVSHPYWRDEQILVPKHPEGYGPWLRVLIVVVILVLLAGFLFWHQRK